MEHEKQNDSLIITQSAGEMLRQARLLKKLSISDLSQETRISKAMIEALEKGEPSLLPGRTYETGYIRLICSVLNEECDSIIDQWIKEHHTKSKKTEYVFLEDKISEKKVPIPLIGVVIGILIIISYAIWLFSSMNENSEENTLGLSELEKNMSVPNTDNNEDFNLQKNIENKNLLNNENLTESIDKDSLKNDMSVPNTDNNKDFNLQKNIENKNLLNNENLTESIDKDSLKNDGVQNNIARNTNNLSSQNVILEDSKEYTDENNEKKSNFLNNVLKLKGIEDSWMQIYMPNGQEFFSGMLKKGELKPIPNMKKFVISLGNAGSVSIQSDDLQYYVIGDKGEIIQSQILEDIISSIDTKIFLRQN